MSTYEKMPNWVKMGHVVSRNLLLEFWDPTNISGTVEDRKYHRFYIFTLQSLDTDSLSHRNMLGGNVRVLLQAAIEAENSSQVYRCILADLVCLTGEIH